MHSLKIQYRALKICFVFVTFDERHTAMKVLYHMKYDWCIKSNIINWCHFQRGNISNDMSCVMDIVVYLHFINYKIPLAVNLLAMMNPNQLCWFSPFNKPKNDRPNILNKFSFGRIKLACYATVPHLCHKLWHQRQLDKDQWMPGIWIETQNYLSRNWLVESPRYEPQSYWWTDGLLALFVIHRSGEFFVLFCFYLVSWFHCSGIISQYHQTLVPFRFYIFVSSRLGPPSEHTPQSITVGASPDMSQCQMSQLQALIDKWRMKKNQTQIMICLYVPIIAFTCNICYDLDVKESLLIEIC